MARLAYFTSANAPRRRCAPLLLLLLQLLCWAWLCAAMVDCFPVNCTTFSYTCDGVLGTVMYLHHPVSLSSVRGSSHTQPPSNTKQHNTR